MSDTSRTKQEYLERYCSGNTEEAKEHEIVKEVMKGLGGGE